MDLSGHCLCGAVSYTVTVEEPPTVAVCHCRNCQRQSGSVLSLVVAVPPAAVCWSGTLASYNDLAESGATVERRFCGKCGSPLASFPAATPATAWLKAGTLDQLHDLIPHIEVWRKSAVSWLKIDPPIASLDRQG